MITEHFHVNSRKLVLDEAIPNGSKIRLQDAIYGVNMRSEFFLMTMVLQQHNYTDKRYRHIFRIPMKNTSFNGFKESCLNQCERIQDRDAKPLFKSTIKRFHVADRKVVFTKTNEVAAFTIRLSRDLAEALGFPGQRCAVDLYGTARFSKYFKNRGKTSDQQLVHFPTKKLVEFRCLEIDRSKHFDNKLATFPVQKVNCFSAYKHLDNSTYFNLIPANHNVLHFTWPEYIHVKNITLTLELPTPRS